MGIVAKQSVWNSITLVTGIILGGINTMILFPMILEPEQYGLTRVLVLLGMVASQFAMIGMPTVLIKFLHNFRNKEGNSFGLLRFVFQVVTGGFFVISLFLFFGENIILKPYSGNATLLKEKYDLLFPLIFFVIINGVLSHYLRAVFHSVFQFVVSEIIMRLAQSVILLMYYFGVIDFDTFMLIFVLIYGMNSLLLLLYLIKIGEFDVKSNKQIITKQNKKSFYKFGVANFFTSIGFRLSNMIDVLMIGAMIGTLGLSNNEGLKAVAIYSLAAYMSSVIEMPARAIGSIAYSIIGKAWANNNQKEIVQLYKKSALNQLIVGGLIFIGIWSSIDGIITILNEVSKESYDYSEIKYVVFFLGIAKLFHAASGINGSIIATSKHYLIGTYVTVSLVFITFLTNWIFIPIYGIVGAAIATAISLFLFNFISFTFLLVKFKMQPFSLKTVATLIIGAGTYYIVSLIPQIGATEMDLIIRSFFVIAIYIPLILGFKISEDFTALINKISTKLGINTTN